MADNSGGIKHGTAARVMLLPALLFPISTPIAVKAQMGAPPMLPAVPLAYGMIMGVSVSGSGRLLAPLPR